MNNQTNSSLVKENLELKSALNDIPDIVNRAVQEVINQGQKLTSAEQLALTEMLKTIGQDFLKHLLIFTKERECKCGKDEMSFGSRMKGYELEIISRRQYENMAPVYQSDVSLYDYCSSCGGRITIKEQ